MTTGNKESYVQRKIGDFEAELDKQINSLLPIKNPIDSMIEEALNMNYDQMKNISAEECSIICYKLAQYVTYLQRIHNRYRNIRRWADNNINIMVAKERGNYGDKFTKWEERRFMVIAGDDYAKSLYDIWLKYGGLEEELFEITNRVRYISQTIQEVKNVR